MSAPALFGTDGIRGVAGDPPLDPRTLFRLGRALGRMVADNPKRFQLLPDAVAAAAVTLGGDTRESTAWIADALTAGLQSAGVLVRRAGTATTPQIAWLTRHSDSALGIVVSASHNPWTDNGIKCFSPAGLKISDEAEAAVAVALAAEPDAGDPPAPAPCDSAAPGRYRDDLLKRFGPRLDLRGMKIVVDCAHGAASAIAPEVLRGLGADVTAANAEPDGRNINEQCGALYPESLSRRVVDGGAHIGLSLDGDADRVMFLDEDGRVLDGDYALAVLADFRLRAGSTLGGAVVGTVMTNLGLEVFLRERGLGLVRTPVGDRHIAEAMRAGGYELGGEQSGHLLLRDETSTGDGLLSALALLEALRHRWNGSLRSASALLAKYPQLLINVRVREKKPFDAIPGIADTVARAQEELGERGRVLLRYSGTENLARVMVEGDREDTIRAAAERIADAVRRAIGRAS